MARMSGVGAAAVGSRPATEFWQQAAVLAMSSIGHRVDPCRGGQPYFWLDLESEPPALRHQSWDYCDMCGRWVDALLLGRVMTGAREWTGVEQQLRGFLASRVGPDGLFYNAEEPAYGSVRTADLFCQSRVLLGLLSWWTETGDRSVEAHLVGLLRGLTTLATWDGGYAHFPGSLWRDGRRLDQPDELGRLDPKVTPALPSPGYRTALLGGLVVAAELTGSRAAMDLAVGLARDYIERSGAVRSDGGYVGHTHSGGVLPTTLGVLRCGLATGRPEFVDWARRVYEFTVGQATSFGWLPDGVGYGDDYFWSRYCETCALADYIEIGILLGENGVGDYWDAVERCARNQLLENQIRSVDGLLPAATAPQVKAATVGGFACAATPNSAVGWRQGLEGCCIGSGLRALYLVWRHGVSERGNTAVVNLPISRTTDLAEVVSRDPYAGAVRIEVRRPCTVEVRIPDCGSAVAVAVNGRVTTTGAPGHRCRLPGLAAGDVVSAAYPLPLRTETARIAGETYTVRWKGRTIVALDPPGDVCATYQRAAYLASEPAGAPPFQAAPTSDLPW